MAFIVKEIIPNDLTKNQRRRCRKFNFNGNMWNLLRITYFVIILQITIY
jgi:hypothetical protein